MALPMDQAEFDFDHALPVGREWFTAGFLAKWWGCSVQKVINLIEEGELEVKIDLRGKDARKTMWRVHRVALVAFLNKRKNL
jgi:hypothetical protein